MTEMKLIYRDGLFFVILLDSHFRVMESCDKLEKD